MMTPKQRGQRDPRSDDESDEDSARDNRVDGAALADRQFLGTDRGNQTYADAMDRVREAIFGIVGDATTPYSGATYPDLRDRLERNPLPETGEPLDEVLSAVADDVLAHSVYPSHETCVAHLQCPPLIPGLAAESMLAAVNQSLDSFDQAPAATVVEERLISALTDVFGFDERGDGVMTSGGTQSNLQGLLLARNRYVATAFDRSAKEAGLPPEAHEMRILSSADAHFTAKQSAAQLGLGEDAVATVPTDDAHQMDVEALRETLDELEREGHRPFALVGTAGTTDFGSVDPLDALADVADEHDLWFHVDAAYGGALVFSDEHRSKLEGIDRADSIAMDFHKLFYQPISCGAFLLRDGKEFERIARNAAYLNPEGDSVPNLVEKSTQTTRRFDALKPYVTFRALGREGLAALVDRTLDVADEAANLLRADPAFELACDPTMNAVTFRYVPHRQHPALSPGEWSDRVNRGVRDLLFESGRAVVARTEVEERAHLKFTLLNPRTTPEDVSELLLRIKQYAAAFEAGAQDASDSLDSEVDE